MTALANRLIVSGHHRAGPPAVATKLSRMDTTASCTLPQPFVRNCEEVRVVAEVGMRPFYDLTDSLRTQSVWVKTGSDRLSVSAIPALRRC